LQKWQSKQMSTFGDILTHADKRVGTNVIDSMAVVKIGEKAVKVLQI